jgi:hypothetical protein
MRFHRNILKFGIRQQTTPAHLLKDETARAGGGFQLLFYQSK